MALFCVISANSGSFRAHCVKVHVRYLISWWVLVWLFKLCATQPTVYSITSSHFQSLVHRQHCFKVCKIAQVTLLLKKPMHACTNTRRAKSNLAVLPKFLSRVDITNFCTFSVMLWTLCLHLHDVLRPFSFNDMMSVSRPNILHIVYCLACTAAT